MRQLNNKESLKVYTIPSTRYIIRIIINNMNKNYSYEIIKVII